MDNSDKKLTDGGSKPPFIHLHIHSEYSLVDSIIRIKTLIAKAQKFHMPAIAMTDQSNLFGMVKFYQAAIAAGVKPIVGVDATIRIEDSASPTSRLVMLCKDYEGYLNLSRLVSRAYQEGQNQGVPHISIDWLNGHTNGLIALSGGRDGDIGQALLAGNRERAAKQLDNWQNLFPGSFYIQLQRTGRPGEEEYLHQAVELASAHHAPVVASNDVRFLDESDFEAHEARVCIQDGRTLDDAHRPRLYSEQQYLREPEEMAELFADIPEALENSVEIAKRCNLELTLGKNYLPDFPIPDGLSTEEFFRRESLSGLEERFRWLLDPDAEDYQQRKQTYLDRLDMELDVIIQMGFPGYFLIVADFIHWAKNNGVPVGPGRGSGAGSLVAYALSITDLDPLAYDLLFERFLNPERVSMPDFDVDFCMEGRDRVIEYVAQHYGREKVSQIITFGTMAAKAVVRDVGRVLGHPYGFVDRIAKLIPFEVGMTLTKAMEESDEFKSAYDDEEVKTLIDLAMTLEGLARNAGKHAGGVVIAPTALTDFAPLYCEQGGGNLVTQYDKDDVESVGLVKFDFLGLRTLTIIDWAVKTINKRHKVAGEQLLDIDRISLDDKAAFDLLKDCATTAVFQLESRGMKDLIKRLQPDCFEDIVALVALFRPGPLQSGMVDDFISRKHGWSEVSYPHPDLESVLKPTYGVILYQEQVMQIAQVLACYSLGEADLLRRAMGKKKPEEMAKQREIFVTGAKNRDVEEKVATHIFDLMEKFAGYGFNKSHSAAYALVAYQTAWLKAHNPAAFMAAVLSSDMDNTDKVVTFIEECRTMELKIRTPDVNYSEYAFTVDTDRAIVYGLGAVKGVGQAAIESMVEERAENGAFGDLFDFCRRIDGRKINRRVLEALIRSGAMDDLGANRATLIGNLGVAIQSAEQHAQTQAAGQNDLFGLEVASDNGPQDSQTANYAPHPDWDDDVRLRGEKETLGLYLTGHPITAYEAELESITSSRLADLNPDDVPQTNGKVNYRKRKQDEKKVTVAGLVVAARTMKTQRGGRIAFITLDDRTARIEVSVFTEAYEKFRDLLTSDRLLVVEGGLGVDDFSGQCKVSADHIYDMEQARETYAKALVIQHRGNGAAMASLDDLEEILSPFREGVCPVAIDYQSELATAHLTLSLEWAVRPTDELLKRLRKKFGIESIQVQY